MCCVFLFAKIRPDPRTERGTAFLFGPDPPTSDTNTEPQSGSWSHHGLHSSTRLS